MEGLYISKPFLFIIPLMMVIILYLLLQVSRLGSDTCTVIIPRYVEIPMVISEPSEAPHALPLDMPSTAFTSTILSKVLNTTTTLAATAPEILSSTTSAPEILQILDQAAEILNNGTSLEANSVTQAVSLVSNASSFENSTLNSNSSSEEDEEESLTTATPLRVNQSSAGMSGDGSQYTLEERGSLYTLDYRIYFKGPQGYISPFHDIPLFADEANKVYNMIVEIPRWTNAKMEIATKDPLNPIKQDEKKGVARFVHNIFPHRGYIWNYGALPQTWEDPNHIVPDTGAKGDNDPIDVIEIGSQVRQRGAVVPVKLIGTLALLDEGETDWKLVTIAVDDPLAAQINNTADVETHFPGLLKATFEWFKHYKIPAGKPANEFGYNGEYKEADFAHKVIADTHEYWKALMKETSPELNTQSLQPNAVHQATQESWAAEVNRQPAHGDAAKIPQEVDKWHFIQF